MIYERNRSSNLSSLRFESFSFFVSVLFVCLVVIGGYHGSPNFRRRQEELHPDMRGAPVMGESVDRMLSQIRTAKEQGADLVEIRLDFLSNFGPKQDLEVLVKQSVLPALITYRPKWEGGEYDGDEGKRQEALRLAVELGADYIDVEVQVAPEFMNSIQGRRSEKTKIIISSHNYQKTPSSEEIGDLAARIQAASADIVKIATTALDITDCARIFQLLAHSQVPTIAIAMSESGLISCILSANYGGFLTFGSIEAGVFSVPGQPTIRIYWSYTISDN